MATGQFVCKAYIRASFLLRFVIAVMRATALKIILFTICSPALQVAEFAWCADVESISIDVDVDVDDIMWLKLDRRSSIDALGSLQDAWKSNIARLQTWEGRLDYRQEYQTSSKVITSVPGVVCADPEVLCTRSGAGAFIIDVEKGFLYSICESHESYTTFNGDRLGDADYPVTFGVVLRPDLRQSLWFEANAHGAKVVSDSGAPLKLWPSKGIFRLDSFAFGTGQASVGHVLDPRDFLGLMSNSVDRTVGQFRDQIERQTANSRSWVIEGDAALMPSVVRITITGRDFISSQVHSVVAAGNIVHSEFVLNDVAVRQESNAHYSEVSGVVLPEIYSYSRYDRDGRVELSRFSEVTTTSINRPVDESQFTWAAFKPSPGQFVFDATTNRRMQFTDQLGLKELKLDGDRALLKADAGDGRFLLILVNAIAALMLYLVWVRRKYARRVAR